MTERVNPTDEYLKSPIVLPIIFERLSKMPDLVWSSAYGQEEASDTKLELMELYVAPRIATYDPEELQCKLSALIGGLEPKWQVKSKDLGILGLRPASVQFRELLVNGEKPFVRSTTIKMLPHAHLADVLATYTRIILNKHGLFVPVLSSLLQHIDYQSVRAVFGREHELVEWASRLFHKAAGEDEASSDKD
jgi:hypothetical protein